MQDASCRGLGCPQNLESPPKNGGQGVDDHRLERGPGGFRGHDRAWPSEERSGFPLPRIREDRPRFHEDGLRGNDRREAQDTSGPRLGVPTDRNRSPKIEDPPQEEWVPGG